MNVNLDRRVRLEEKVTTQDATYGNPVVTWALVASVWAEMREVLPSRSEAVKHNLESARNQVRVRIRYRAGVDSAMRIVWDGVVFNIVGGPAELGRREYLELVCERHSTEGAS